MKVLSQPKQRKCWKSGRHFVDELPERPEQEQKEPLPKCLTSHGSRAQRPSSHTDPLGAWLREAEGRLKPGETQRHCPAPTRTDLAIRFPKTTGNWAQVKITGLNQLLLKQFCIFGEDQNTALCQRLKQIKLFGINHWPGENRLFMVYYTLRGIKISCIIYIYNTGTPEAGAARSLQHPRQVASGIPRHNSIENLGVTKSFLCKRD